MSTKGRRDSGGGRYHCPGDNFCVEHSGSDLCHQYQLDNVDEVDEDEENEAETGRTPEDLNIVSSSSNSHVPGKKSGKGPLGSFRLRFGSRKKKGANGSKKNKSNHHKTAGTFSRASIDNDHDLDLETGHHLLDGELSNGLPSALFDLVDVEGNIIGMSLRLGEEESGDLDIDGDHLPIQYQYNNNSENRGNPGEDDEEDINEGDEEEGDEGDENDLDPLANSNSFGDLDRSSSMKNSTASGNLRRVDGGGENGAHGHVRRLSVISNGRVFTHGRGYHLHNHCHTHRHLRGAVGRDNSTSAQSNSSTSTITQHYYPEGGYGYIILFTALLAHLLMCGLNLCAGLIVSAISHRFAGPNVRSQAGWLGSCSVGLSLLLSPLWVSICKRKSTRLAAVFGGLVAALGCLFTSFATQLHQVFFSYATILGVGVGLGRDAASLMVGQYFKRKRDMVEMVLVSASGLGILVMSILMNKAINLLGWRLGLQVVTGCLFICFFLATFYRSASLYHPQRRAILHLKNQKRKVKDKEKREDKPPFLDVSCLRSKTLQILLLSSALVAFGIYTPIFYLTMDYKESFLQDELMLEEEEKLDSSILYVYVGVAWILGCFVFGLLVLQKSKECRVSKQYLCQVAGIICGISIVTLTIVKGQSGLLIFACIYGFSLGGYNYSLKVYTYDRVRARHFPRAWSFIQSSQGIPIFLGVPLSGYLNESFPGLKAGYYLSAVTVFLGSAFLFLADIRKFTRRKSQNSSTKTCETTMTEKTGVNSSSRSTTNSRRLSFAFPVEEILSRPSNLDHKSNANSGKQDLLPIFSSSNMDLDHGAQEDVDHHHGNQDDDDVEGQQIIDLGDLDEDIVKELTCISEEAIADMDFQDVYWEDFFGRGECITSYNKEEDCLVSESENLHNQHQHQRQCPIIVGRNQKYPKGQKFRGLDALVQGVASLGTRLPDIPETPTPTPILTPSRTHKSPETANVLSVPDSRREDQDSAV